MDHEKIFTWSVGELSTLEWNADHVHEVVMSGRVDILQWLLQKKLLVRESNSKSNTVCTGVQHVLIRIDAVCLAVSCGFLHMVRWFEENCKEHLVRPAFDNYANYIKLMNVATVNGHIHVLEYLYAHGGYSLPEHIRERVQWCLTETAEKGHSVMLEWWRRQGMPLEDMRRLHALRRAVLNQRWPVVLWLETHILDRNNLAREYVLTFRFQVLHSAPFVVHDWIAMRTSLADWVNYSDYWSRMRDVQEMRQKSLLTLILCNRRRRKQHLPAEVWRHLVAPLLDLPG